MPDTITPAYVKGPPPSPYNLDASDRHLALDLRVTLGEMPLADGFEVTLSDVDLDARVGDLLDLVFGPNVRDEAIASLIDSKRNPDLPEMYEALLDTFADLRDRRCSLQLHRNHGPEMQLTDDVGRHLASRPASHPAGSPRPMLDVVVEQRYTPLAYAAERWYGGDLGLLLDRQQEHVLLYFVGHYGHQLPTEPEASLDAGLLPIAARLVEQGALTAPADGDYQLTEAGEDRLDRAEAEVEASIRLYDLFADIVYEPGRIEFGGPGADLRVDVYESEGLDAAEALILRQLYDGTLEDLEADWREAILDDEFFAELLMDLADRERVDTDLLEEIIEAGFAHVDELEEQADREAQQRRLEAQARKR
jgi:hypothetical protein